MNLGGRAAIAVPLIGLIAALFLAGFSALTYPPDGMFSKGSTFQLVFVYTAIIAIPAGYFLSLPAVAFGHFLPRPRGLSFCMVGVTVGLLLSVLLARPEAPDALGLIGFTLMGLLCGSMWWLLVERHREEECT